MAGFRIADLSKFLAGLSTRQLLPFLSWRDMVTPETLKGDSYAALTGATIVLPQGVAFAAIAGLPPEYGFYSAMITPVVAALFGSSWHVVSGPTTAISALVFGALSGSFEPGSGAFIQAAISLTLLVGIFQLALGLARLGSLVDFVSHSVMVGFMAGAATLVALSQLDNALGIILPRPDDIVAFFVALYERAVFLDWRSALIAFISLAVAVVSKRYFPKLPNYLIALLAGSFVSIPLEGRENGVEVVGAKYNLKRTTEADLANHARRSAAAWQDAHAHLHLHEFRFAASREPHITSQPKLMAATSGKALDLGNCRLGQFADPLQHNLQIQQLYFGPRHGSTVHILQEFSISMRHKDFRVSRLE